MNVEVLSVRGLRPKCGKVDRDLWLWFLEAKKDYKNYHGPRVTKRMVQNKAMQAFKDAGITGFKASDGWYVRWIKRWHRFECENADKDHGEAVEETDGNMNIPSLKNKTSKRRSKKCGNKIMLSLPRNVDSTDSLSFQEQELFASSSSSYPIDKLQILHDVASRELADSIFQEMNSIEGKNRSFEQSSHLINEISQTGQSDSSSFLDFDQISWNDVPYVDKAELSSNPGALYRIDENNLNYTSSVMSQMMEFAEICHLKEKELQQQHNNLPEQVPSKLLHQAEDERLCGDYHQIQHQDSLQNSAARTFPLPCSSSNSQQYVCSENEYQPDNSFYSMDDGNFLILNANDSEFAPHHTDYQSDKIVHDIQKDDVSVLLSATYSNQPNIMKINDADAKGTKDALSDLTADVLEKKYQSSQVNVIKVNGDDANFAEKVPAPNGKNVDILMNGSCKSYHMSVIGLGCVSVQEPQGIYCTEQGGIDVSLDTSQHGSQLNIVGLNHLSYNEGTEMCTSSRSNVDVIFSESHLSEKQATVKFNCLDLNLSENSCSDKIESPAAAVVGNEMDHSESELNSIRANEKECSHSTSDSSMNISVDSHYQPHQINIIALNSMNLNCPTSITTCKRNNVGVLYNGECSANEVNIIELNNFTSTEADVLCSVAEENIVFNGDFNTDRMNIVELDTFNVNGSGNIEDGVVLHTDFQADHVSIIEPNSLNLEEAENNYSGSDRTFLSPIPQGLMPCEALRPPSAVSGSESHHCVDTQLALGANSESSLLLFTESPFSFNDDEMSDVLPMPPTNVSLPTSNEMISTSNVQKADPPVLSAEKLKKVHLTSSNNFVCMASLSSSDILVASKDGTDSDLDLVDSVILDQVVRMEDQQNQRLKVNFQSLDKATSTDEDHCHGKDAGNDHRPPPRRLGGERYLPCFKRKVLEYAAQHTAKDAAKQFHVHADTVTLWSRSKEAKIPVASVLPDQQMLSWLKQKRESGALLTRSQISCKVKELLQTPGSWQKNKSRWFYVWGSRFSDLEKAEGRNKNSNKPEGGSSLAPSSFSKALYPDEFKVEVALFAERTSQNLAASVFNIARKRVFEWVAALKGSRKSDEDHPKGPINNCTSNDKKGDHNIKKPKHLSDCLSSKEVSAVVFPKTKLKGKGLGRALTSVAVDRELWEWFCEQTAQKKKPKSREIRSKAVELFRAHKYEHIRCSHGWFKKWSMRHGIVLRHEGDSDLLVWCLEQFDYNRNISHRDLLQQAYNVLSGTYKSDFKASAGWALRFCKRHRSLLSSRPSFDIDLPDELEDRVNEFRLLTRQLIGSLKVTPQGIGSMDEVPLNFTAGGSGGPRSRLLLRRSGFENCHATVVLCCLSDGTLLPPAVIFKGSGPPEWIKIDGVCVLVLHQEESCMSTCAMLQWLQFIWFKNVRAPSILVLDCFEPHSAESVKEAFAAEQCHLSVIPAGCSSKLQPLDMSVTGQFEAIIADRWAKHYSSLDHFSTIKRSSYSSNSDVIKWVAEAFSKLQASRKDAIQCSFVVMGLTSDHTHSEDLISENISPFLSEG